MVPGLPLKVRCPSDLTHRTDQSCGLDDFKMVSVTEGRRCDAAHSAVPAGLRGLPGDATGGRFERRPAEGGIIAWREHHSNL
jgi:hypothetical protein